MRARLLALLRVPERPEPPPGAGERLETFRATKGFLYYSVLAWLPKQAAALSGLIFSLAFFGQITDPVERFMKSGNWERLTEQLTDVTVGFGFLRLDLVATIIFFERLAIAAFLVQLVFTGLLLKLSWELRWYMVGERALRIRHGLWKVREQTMTIANIQNMIVRQGPLQRLLGFSDLEISTAGGGGKGASGEDPTEAKDSFHVGRFRGLEDASALRDELRRRLQAIQAGTPAASTEPESVAQSEAAHEAQTTEPAGALESAARALLAEARALRRHAESLAPR